jgi:hypothetical protein
MTHPKNVKDLALAPVAAEIDHNLQRLRGKSPEEIRYELELELDEPAKVDSRDSRAELVLALAVRNADLHGWTVTITDDASAVRLTGGSVSLDIALGAGATAFVGATPAGATS